MSGLIELKKTTPDGKEEVLHFQAIRDNKKQITELLCELNIVDDFNDENKEKIIELAMALSSHNGELIIE